MENYVGLDVSLKQTAICIVDRTGKVQRGIDRAAGKCIVTHIEPPGSFETGYDLTADLVDRVLDGVASVLCEPGQNWPAQGVTMREGAIRWREVLLQYGAPLR